MIVVADSGPLHYLILLEHTELLRRFYGLVLVPEPVAEELSAARAPPFVREWILGGFDDGGEMERRWVEGFHSAAGSAFKQFSIPNDARQFCRSCQAHPV